MVRLPMTRSDAQFRQKRSTHSHHVITITAAPAQQRRWTVRSRKQRRWNYKVVFAGSEVIILTRV